MRSWGDTQSCARLGWEHTRLPEEFDDKVVHCEHMGINGHCVAKGTSKTGCHRAEHIQRAPDDQARVPKSPNFTLETAWKEHAKGSALGTPHNPPDWNNVLIDVVFRKKGKNAMEPIRRAYDSTTLKEDIEPLRLVGDGEEQFDLGSRSC
jgi:hypothetical protein